LVTKTLTGLELIEIDDLALAGQNLIELNGTFGLIFGPGFLPLCRGFSVDIGADQFTPARYLSIFNVQMVLISISINALNI
jgi:hypothetical protein